MLFNSLQFVIFFPLVTLAYFLLPHKYRWFLLLSASCVFYAAFIPIYILILAFTIVVDYFAGILIAKKTGKQKLAFLVMSIVANVGVLAFFKYFNFLNENFAYLAQLIHWNYPISALAIILPIGLSFHTFQAMSYTIEVYRGNHLPERNFGIYALYVMFYPQLVAGPIERPQNLIHQFYEHHQFDYQRAVDGLKLMAWGMFKKVVIADRLAILVNQVYSQPSDYAGPSLMLATVLFAFQIYCDFSGYSSIAIGAARVMGFKLMNNFDRPYLSRSISEFWARWHISLSTWFRDYLYIPLGGNRVSKWRWQFNILLTFLISGLWHGANWTYVAWGAINGLYLVVSNVTSAVRKSIIDIIGINCSSSLYRFFRVFTTFSLVCFAWIFFRAKDIHEALYVAGHIFSGLGSIFSIEGIKSNLRGLGFDRYDYLIVLLSLGLMEFIQRRGEATQVLSERLVWFRWPLYYLVVMAILLFGVFNKSQFIYFQF